MFQDCSCSCLMGNGTKVNTRGKQTAQREMQEYDLHHIKPLFALLMKYLTPLVWRFQGSDRVFLYNTWKSLFVPHAIGKCWQDELLKPVGCSLRAKGWKQSLRRTGRIRFALQGYREVFWEPKSVLSNNGMVLCKAQDICCVLGHSLNPKDSSSWQDSLIYKGACSACTIPGPGEEMLQLLSAAHCSLGAGDPWGS